MRAPLYYLSYLLHMHKLVKKIKKVKIVLWDVGSGEGEGKWRCGGDFCGVQHAASSLIISSKMQVGSKILIFQISLASETVTSHQAPGVTWSPDMGTT